MKNNLKIYIINLKKDIEKKEYMKRLCEEYDLDVEFIEAVYGKSLTKNEISLVYSKTKSQSKIKRELALPELGCALSHRSIYKKMIDNNIKEALILEDDIEFDNKLLGLLSKKSLFPKNWELVLLGHHTGSSSYLSTRSSIWWKKNLYNDFNLKIPSEVSKGTYGYLINQNGAKKLFDELREIKMPIDHYTGDNKFTNLYIIKPEIIKINKVMSDEMTTMSDRENLQKSKASKNIILKKIIRALGLFKLIMFLVNNLKRIYPLRRYK